MGESSVHDKAGFLKRYLYSVTSFLRLFAWGWLRPSGRVCIRNIAEHLGYRDRTRPRCLVPSIELPDIIAMAPNIELNLHELHPADGNISVLELVALASLVRLQKPRIAFEIGTFDGRSTLNLAANTDELSRVYTLDLDRNSLESTAFPLDEGDRKYVEKEISGSKYLGTEYAKRIVQLYGDSATFDFSPYTSLIEFAFVDGAHSYDYLMSDTKNTLRMMAGGRGTIVWHDYDSPFWPDVTVGLNNLYLQEPSFRNLKHIAGTTLVYLRLDTKIVAPTSGPHPVSVTRVTRFPAPISRSLA